MGFEWQASGMRAASKTEAIKISICSVRTEGPKLRITFAHSFMASMGWSAGDRIGIGIGDGPDLGMIQLRARPNGYVLQKPSRGGRAYIYCQADPTWPKVFEATVPECRADTIGKKLTITLPWEVIQAPK